MLLPQLSKQFFFNIIPKQFKDKNKTSPSHATHTLQTRKQIRNNFITATNSLITNIINSLVFTIIKKKN